MPHCILEHSSNILDTPDWNKMLGELHRVLTETKEFNQQDIKSRVIGHDVYFMGDGNPKNAFVTLNIQILDGRSDDFKKQLAQAAIEILEQYFPKSMKELTCSLTVQVSDIHRISYSRKIT